MRYTDKHIVETYSGLFEGLSSLNKIELIESLSKSLKTENKTKVILSINHLGHFPQKNLLQK